MPSPILKNGVREDSQNVRTSAKETFGEVIL